MFETYELEQDVLRLAKSWLKTEHFNLRLGKKIRKPDMEWANTGELELVQNGTHISVMGPFMAETEWHVLHLLKEQLLHKLAVRAEGKD